MYQTRDIAAQGDYFARHIQAINEQQLEQDSQIAAELAHRDMEIDRLRSVIEAINNTKNNPDRNKTFLLDEIYGRCQQALNSDKSQPEIIAA